MEGLINEESDWNHNEERDAVIVPFVVVVSFPHQSPKCGV